MIELAVKSEINEIRYTMMTFIDPSHLLPVNVLLLSTDSVKKFTTFKEVKPDS